MGINPHATIFRILGMLKIKRKIKIKMKRKRKREIHLQSVTLGPFESLRDRVFLYSNFCGIGEGVTDYIE
jgi:hypothetical protein